MESPDEKSSILFKMRKLIHFNDQEKKSFILNLFTIGAFIAYIIGIYLHVGILGNEWGNIAVDLSLRILGPVLGLILVVLLGLTILLFTFYVKRLRVTNIYLCWFWIISLYQCAVNSFLQFFGLPDEPINLFFKILFPDFWYPIKEIAFITVSIILTFFWVKKANKIEINRIDIVLIAVISTVMIVGTLSSQILLINV